MMLKWIDIVKFLKNGNPPPPQKVIKSNDQWKKILNQQTFEVARMRGTERAFSSDMCSLFEPGLYACACCDTKLFNAEEKFDSGTGWPSFTQPIQINAIGYVSDESYGMDRVEVICNCCEAHLGHVFPDGPNPSGLRYCINALSLKKV